MSILKMFETYNKAKKIFKRPKLKFKACYWPNNPLCSRFLFLRNKRIPLSWDITQYRYNKEKNITEITWDEQFQYFLDRNHLSFIKPTWTIPTWLSFHIFNDDVDYKIKWEDFRMEYPPQFSIVLFGISFSLYFGDIETTYGEKEDYNYWETLLTYVDKMDLYKENVGQLVRDCGSWHSLNPDRVYMALDKNYLKKEYWDVWEKATNTYFKEIIKKND